jgi:2-haloacid dehalogenase
MSGPNPKIKAVFFDFMGTCLNWHEAVTRAFPTAIPEQEASKFALEWRRRYFIANSDRNKQGLPVEDIDVTLSRILNLMLDESPVLQSHFPESLKTDLIKAWHAQPAWPEVKEAIHRIRQELGLEVFVHANGTTRLQLDLTRSSGLDFNMLFSSQLMGVYKPNPEAYKKGLELVQLAPEEVVLVAAHAYDLRGAQNCGMRTIYVYRWTDDVDEDQEALKKEFNIYLEDMTKLPEAINSLA